MKRFRAAALSLTLGSCVVTQQICYSQNGTAGTTVTYQVTPNVYSCGNQGTNAINCDGIPFNLSGTPAGSMWLYGNPGGPSGHYGWGFFFAPAPMAGNQFTMNQWSYSPTAIVPHNGYPYGFTSFPCNNNCSVFSGTIKGMTTDGQAYTANVTVGFWYYRSCGGRTCTESAIVTGGTVSVTYD